MAHSITTHGGMPTHPRSLLEVVGRKLGPQYCPSCGMDFFTNPYVTAKTYPLHENVVLRCDCLNGAYGLSREEIDDALAT